MRLTLVNRHDAKEAGMPLSEYEQRVLEQLERDLGADPKLGRTMARQPRSRGRLVFAVFGVIAGLAVLLIGAATQIVILGVAGFAIMALAALWAMLGPRERSASESSTTGKSSTGKGAASAKKSGKDDRPFMVRLEERFERRREQGDL
jgi:Flp pilus assembly protein TadB